MRKRQHLNALRVFEAVARLGSMSAAADELCVTRPAVSKQVALLEDEMGCRLLNRHGNKIHTTDTGRELFEGLNRAFDVISLTTTSVMRRNQTDSTLRLLVCRDFASNWLAPRVGGFLRDNPRIAVEIVSEKNGTFRREESFDLRIFYGLPGVAALAGPHAVELCRWIDLPVCTPDLAARDLGSKTDLCDTLHLVDANYDIWQEWCDRASFYASAHRSHVVTFNDTTLCLAAADTGTGLTVSDTLLSLGSIASGRMIIPVPVGLVSEQAYYLLKSSHAPPHGAAQRFEQWLQQEMASYQQQVEHVLHQKGICIIPRSA